MRWRKFEKIIVKAEDACKSSNVNDLDHFVSTDKMVEIDSKYF